MNAASIENRIVAEYERRGDSAGWRFLASPFRTIANAQIVFIGLNPGGASETEGHGQFSCENGSAYETEAWAHHPAGRSPLQLQVKALFEIVGAAPDEVLAGNLIPFRSKNLSDLRDFPSALQFGTKLWTEILGHAPRRLVIGMGKDVQSVLFDHYRVCPTSEPTGWGNQKLRYAKAEDTRVVGLPHLSRFRIFNREGSPEERLKTLLQD